MKEKLNCPGRIFTMKHHPSLMHDRHHGGKLDSLVHRDWSVVEVIIEQDIVTYWKEIHAEN